MNEEKPSERLIEQRLRNRIMEELWGHSRDHTWIKEVGAVEWFESFFDHFPYEGQPHGYPAMTTDEATAVGAVCLTMQQAIADLPKNPTVQQIIHSGWPDRIRPVAQSALDLLTVRGRLAEEFEEAEPSSPIPWPPNGS
ncbi:hypothetical protein [Sphingomonas psychrotolerans]|uniref:Uncharacterized protein n=1 Tax=Sphingomonas psychrotolerans TaxID=1327635 RepID=A0A2K8MAD4_9SPHN|nr:hypothetical protein [Sphingomonas psychrotolerans]ATY30817.1 hypothetical protein CVN68_01455 [Sphingomonas psychrotolerans]